MSFETQNERAFFVTVWGKCIRNLGFGDMLTSEDKPLDDTGKEILSAVCGIFEKSGKGRLASGSACLSADDGFHLHLGLYSPSPMARTAVSKKLGNAHVEPQRASKDKLIEYIQKKGEYAEKGETVLSCTESMDGFTGYQGNRSDLSNIDEMIKNGCTPNDIFDSGIKFRKYDKLIKDAYFRKRYLDTPLVRPVYVEWHVGDTGSGKTYKYVELAEKYGADNVYMLSDYANGGFDGYCGEKVLFMDEFRGQMPFNVLLMLLQGYKQQVHARYTNVLGLWDEVYISSILPPDVIYKRMVEKDNDLDTLRQLYRRINKIVYHYKKDNQYMSFEMPMEEYRNYDNLKLRALPDEKEKFVTCTPEEIEQMSFLFQSAEKSIKEKSTQ